MNVLPHSFQALGPYWIRLIAAELSAITRYYDQVIQWKPLPEDSGYLFSRIECPRKITAQSLTDLPDGIAGETDRRTAILLKGNLNHSSDIQKDLEELKSKLPRTSRILVVAYSPYHRWLFQLATFLGIRKGELPTTFVTETDVRNLGKLTGYELVWNRPFAYLPWQLLGLGSLINFLLPLVPFFRRLSLASLLVLRPGGVKVEPRPSLSIVIPARNERGNIENALKRIPDLQTTIEVIFVEGHSNDQTWEEILRVIPLYSNRFRVRAFRQQGKGKADAVRLGFRHAEGDVLTILDADLTMPPEKLGRFFEAYCSGLADFVNGTRLLYPMEGQAMRFLNRLGNVFFAKALSLVLGISIGDSLCGTKLMARHDYRRIQAWATDFGDFDPFGDFELLFPAAILGLGVLDVPVAYRARTYGSTNISRFRHGWMLLKMTGIGLSRIRTGKLP